MFSEEDLLQIQKRGINMEQINLQMDFFKKGIPHLNIVRPAIAGDGILIPSKEFIHEMVSFYETEVQDKIILKFVPASGAATRMFKALYEFLAKPLEEHASGDAEEVIRKLREFAFYTDLLEILAQKGINLQDILRNKSDKLIIGYILNEDGLNYGNLPKGLLKFHKYPEGNRTSVEEHLAEGALYAKTNKNKTVFIHFTVSPEHLSAFRGLTETVKPFFEKKFGVTYHITFSVQKGSTDTIAADGINNPFRNSDGSLVFRPGGHGALLDNLNDLNADLIFIKNIDNVVPDRLKNETVQFKKVLGGHLLHLQTRIFGYMKILDNEGHYSEDIYNEVKEFIESNLGYKFPLNINESDENQKKQSLIRILNRPIRVCGMVKNTGEPGGGPFWIQNKSGAQSLQILESSQFNISDEKHRQIFKGATHFNPVDLVVSTHDYKGRKYDLNEFRDPETGFISIKSKDGKELKALELPGLWNGSMAFWNTAFIEVPIITFNPVKTINDLLRPEHQ